MSVDLFEPTAGEPDATIVSAQNVLSDLTSGVPSDLVTPPAGRRVRLLSASIGYDFGGPSANLDCPAKLVLREKSSGRVIVQLGVAPGRPSDQVDYVFDLPTDDILTVETAGVWAKVSLSYSVRHRLV